MSNPNDDPVYGAIEAHRLAAAAYDMTVARAADGDPLSHEQNLAAFAILNRCCQRLVAAEFTTFGGLVVLLAYLASRLAEPGAPSMPLEVGVPDQAWESAFAVFCANLAARVAALMAARGDQ